MPFTGKIGFFGVYFDGTAGNDTGSFGSGVDWVFGLGGDDAILGGAGNDLLDGGSGNDSLFGEADDDTIMGGAGQDSLWGGAGDDVLDGGAGHDILSGGAGHDSMTGGDGNDLYFVDSLNDVVTEAADGGQDHVSTSTQSYTLGANIETLSYLVESANFIGAGNAADNTIFVSDGSVGTKSATIYGLDGNDTLSGGAGSDVLIGGQGDDVLQAGAGDVLDGGVGDDVFKFFAYAQGAAGAVVNGGAGYDTLDFLGAAKPIDINLFIGANDWGMTISGIEGVSGTSGADKITGHNGPNILAGRGGADKIFGLGGDDIIRFDSIGHADAALQVVGGVGFDRMEVGGDGITWTTALGPVTDIEALRLTGQGHLKLTLINTPVQAQTAFYAGIAIIDAPNASNLTIDAAGFSAASQLYVFGSPGNDTLIGGAGNDTFYGRAGIDLMKGNGGHDQYVVDNAPDPVVETAGQGIDSAWVTANGWTMAANLEIGRLIGLASHLQGGDGAEDLVANAGAASGSTIKGGDGSDTLWGSSMADVLMGEAGDDILRGYGGADAMWGGIGNDHFIIDEIFDTASELAGEGYDTAWVTTSGWTAGLNIEVVYLSGNASSVAGSAMAENLVANSILGSSLDGRGGNDILWGSNADDTLRGGAQDDIAYGYAGADIFVFDSGDWGWDQISDFSAAQGDKLDFRGSGATSMTSLTLNSGADTIVTFGRNSIWLYGVTSLSTVDCIFG